MKMPPGALEAAEFAQEIDRILRGRPGGGQYRVEIERDNGTATAGYVSWSTGMIYSATKGGYERTFCRDLPRWLAEEHPAHVWHICKRALERGMEVPAAMPLPVSILE